MIQPAIEWFQMLKYKPDAHSQLRAAREGGSAQLVQLEDVIGQLRAELEVRHQEVEQLTTLSLRGDATVQEYMSNLKVGAG